MITDEEFQAAITLSEGALESKLVERCFKEGDFFTTRYMLLNGVSEYRIKPQPFECWVNVYDDGEHNAYDKEKSAVENAYEKTVRVAVHMREVVDE